ncbi:MAG TPA: VWA domain-containing protein [Tepidisphaeraceae bacterium]
MKRFIEILFGIKPAPWAEGGTWRLEWLSMPKHDKMFLLIVLVLFAGYGVLWLYRREGRNLAFPIRAGLGALRMIVLLGIVAMLLEPVLIISKKEFVPSNLVVLMDRSESMELKDAYVDQAKASNLVQTLKLTSPTELRDKTRLGLAQRAMEIGLAEQLSARGDRIVQVRSFASQLMPEGATTQPVTASEKSTTAVGNAVRQALNAYRGQPLAGVLVLTDGQSNAGEMPMKAAEAAAADGVPIVAVAAGTPEGPRNAKLTKIESNPVVFVRDPNQLHVLIESKGLTNANATLVLERRKDGGPWEEIAHNPITLEEAGRVQSIPFDFKEDQPAKLEFRARLADVGPELTADDNIATAEVRVIRQKIKVLFIAGSTFPEVEFIRNAILRDAGLQASTWLQTADANYIQPGNPVIKRLPNTQDELNDFDCIVLYDPDPALWPPEYPQMLINFVAQAGGGLVYVAGERETKDLFERPEDPAVAFISMLPVVSEPGLYRTDVSVKLSSQEPWRLEITPEGRGDPIFQFSQKSEDNENILSSLPGMYWHYPVTRAKPGATVLARHGDPRMRNEHGPHVLLATQRVGPGRTFWVGFDSTYRWRYLDEQFFDGFWARMIDRAGRAKQLGGRYPYTLATDRATYRPGSNVTLTATFENALERDTGLEQLHGEVEVTDQPPIPITLNPRPGDANTFETSFPVNHPGLHFIRVWSGGEDLRQVAKAATLQFQVELPNLEYDRPGNDLASLQAMAKASHGGVFEMDQLNQVADTFKIKRVARVLEDRQEIFDAPILFITILLALFAEWILRKKFRMV